MLLQQRRRHRQPGPRYPLPSYRQTTARHPPAVHPGCPGQRHNAHGPGKNSGGCIRHLPTWRVLRRVRIPSCPIRLLRSVPGLFARPVIVAGFPGSPCATQTVVLFSRGHHRLQPYPLAPVAVPRRVAQGRARPGRSGLPPCRVRQRVCQPSGAAGKKQRLQRARPRLPRSTVRAVCRRVPFSALVWLRRQSVRPPPVRWEQIRVLCYPSLSGVNGGPGFRCMNFLQNPAPLTVLLIYRTRQGDRAILQVYGVRLYFGIEGR